MAKITIEHVCKAWQAWRSLPDNATYAERMDAYGKAAELHLAWQKQNHKLVK